MDHMDWYFSRETSNQETPDLLRDDNLSSLPEYWFQWRFTTAERFGLPNNHTSIETKPPTEQMNSCRETPLVQALKELPLRECQASSSSSPCGRFSSAGYKAGSSDSCVQNNGFLSDRPDYMLQKLSQSQEEQMEDIFMNSFLEKDPPGLENSYQHMGLFTDSDCVSGSFDNLFTGMIVDSQSTSKDSSTMGGSNYTKLSGSHFGTDDFLDNWTKIQDSPCWAPSNSARMEGSSAVKDSMLRVTPIKLNNDVGEENSLESNVLQELKGVMTQLNQETRICFRDAMYRLAKSSRRSREATETISDFMIDEPFTEISSRLNSMEAATNAVDRTVANLMFNKLNFSPWDLSSLASVQLSKATLATSGLHLSNLKQPLVAVDPRLSALLTHEFEVPDNEYK